MKTKLLMFATMMALSFYTTAQDSDFDEDIMKLLNVNGSKQVMEPMINQMIGQFRAMNSSAPADFWALLKLDLKADLTELNQKMVPIYKKHFTQEEVKGLIEFYESPLGKSLTTKTPQVMMESMQIGQQWGMEISAKVQQRLKDEGY
ncbi:MAG: DUF2059 domain-containing protein [Cyclobacteriaceae bacterium]